MTEEQKQAKREYNRKWREANLEYCRKQFRKWYQENREKHCATARNWYWDNRERSRAKSRKWKLANAEKVRVYSHVSYLRKYAANAKKILEANRKWRQSNPDKALEVHQNWYRSNPEKIRAHRITHRAINGKKLIRQPCQVCGNGKSQAHHPDYTKPLEVRWLCALHHAREHHPSQ